MLEDSNQETKSYLKVSIANSDAPVARWVTSKIGVINGYQWVLPMSGCPIFRGTHPT